jgi:hypothetical protein
MTDNFTITSMQTEVGIDGTITATFTLDTGDTLVITATRLECKVHMLSYVDDILDVSQEEITAAVSDLIVKKCAAAYAALYPEVTS